MKGYVAVVALLAMAVGFVGAAAAANKDKGPEELDMLSPRIEKVIPAGKTVRLKMPALKPGKYPFVGEYHSETAKATIVAE